MLEIASQMILCLLLAALIGAIIGYLLGKSTCVDDDCGQDDTDSYVDNNYSTHTTHGIATTSMNTGVSDIVSSAAVGTTATAAATIFRRETSSDLGYIGKEPSLLTAARNGKADDLTYIKGIEIKVEEELNNSGIYHYDQIASWDTDNIEWANDTLGFPGRAGREEWSQQAKILASGGETAFSKSLNAEGRNSKKGSTTVDSKVSGMGYSSVTGTTSGSKNLGKSPKTKVSASGGETAFSKSLNAEGRNTKKGSTTVDSKVSGMGSSSVTGATSGSGNISTKPVLLTAARNGKADNLTHIKGIGDKVEEELNNSGIYHYDQIASWDDKNIAWANDALGFPGRAEREKWVAQAIELSKTLDTGSNSSTIKPEILSGPRNGKSDNLTRIKGVGAKIEEKLNNSGIYHYDQIASWDTDNIEWADETLGFPGRAEREEWVKQAKALASGEATEFSKRVDAGEVTSSKKS